MTSTLILVFHRDLSQSRANAALARAVADLSGVETVDMQARYPEGRIDWQDDAGREAQRLLDARRIVLQFPLQWYSVPPLLKAWQDAVLTRMFYINPESEGARLAGTPLMIAATAGNTAQSYTRGGANRFSMEELLAPLRATARRCGLPWHPPHLVHEADRLEPAALNDACESYARAVSGFIAATSERAVPQEVS